jgi:hypothetical protein
MVFQPVSEQRGEKEGMAHPQPYRFGLKRTTPSLLYVAKYIKSLRCHLSECKLSKLTGSIQLCNRDQR